MANLRQDHPPGIWKTDRVEVAYAGLVLAALFWSGNFIAGRALRGQIDPLTLNALRWLICLAVFLPFVAPRLVRKRAVVIREWRLVSALGVTGIALFHTLVYAALRETTVINALLILSLAPAAIFICAATISEIRPTVWQWVGAGIALAGAAILITRGSLEKALAFDFNRGDAWMLAAVAAWTAYSLLLRRRPADLPQDVTLGASIIVALCALIPVTMLLAPPSWPALSIEAWAAVGYVAIFSSLIAFLLWSRGIAEIGAARSGQFVHLMPVFGAILAVLLLGETVSPTQMAGGFCVIVGIVLVNRKRAMPSGRK